MIFNFPFLKELLARIAFWKEADRLGPDLPWTHWQLHFKSTMSALGTRKFRKFGSGAEFRPGAYAVTCSKIELGNRVVIRPGTMLFADPRTSDGGYIVIEDDVMIGAGVHIYVANHRFDDTIFPIIEQGHMPSKTVTLRKGCWIGANSILLPGIEVGENAVVGAGSVVTKSVPPRALAVGNPACVIRELN